MVFLFVCLFIYLLNHLFSSSIIGCVGFIIVVLYCVISKRPSRRREDRSTTTSKAHGVSGLFMFKLNCCGKYQNEGFCIDYHKASCVLPAFLEIRENDTVTINQRGRFIYIWLEYIFVNNTQKRNNHNIGIIVLSNVNFILYFDHLKPVNENNIAHMFYGSSSI